MRRPDDVRPRRRAGRLKRASPGAGRVSLARALSKFGVTSRKQAALLVAAGRVSVGGRVVTAPEEWIDPRRDRVTVDGRLVGDDTERLVIAFHKPVGLVTTRVDPAGRPTVYDALRGVPAWVFPVGRLDRDTSGLLVLTNDHRLGHRLTDPAHHVPKTYHARVQGLPERTALQALREGVALPDGAFTRPAKVRFLGAARDGTSWLELVLTEGRNRQVRRMCAAVGHDVRDLVRVRIGCLELGDLAPGAWRRLLAADIALLEGAGRRVS
jgi:23S rRNA pseudouridine2605 synthase